ncbi:MAG: MFS transporter [Candidatus Bathyarchaeia archaeon]
MSVKSKPKQFQALIAINVLDAFITGAYMLTVPLLMIKRGISLSGIGLVFSAFPIAFLTFRMLFSSAADSIGFRKFFYLNALGNLASASLYAVSMSPSSYAAAKAVQGVKEAALWAVNRSAAYEAAGDNNPQMASSTLLFIRAFAITVGAAASGLLISYISFEYVYTMLAAVSASIFIPSWISNTGRRGNLTLRELFRRLDPRMVGRKTWRTAFVMSLYTAASTFVAGFVLPIFLHERGLGYWEVGIILAAYMGTGAFLIPVTIRASPPVDRVVYAQALLYIPAAVLTPLIGGESMIIMVLIMGLGESISYITWESLISREAVGRENMATTIGFLHAPSNLVLIPSYVIAGVLVEKYGYMAPFSAAAVLFLLYSVAALRNLTRSS